MKKLIKMGSIVSILIIASMAIYGFKANGKSSTLVKHAVTNGSKCTYCNGSGTCSSCQGEGKIICAKCDGKGKGEEIKLNYGFGGHQIITCPDCDGKGSSKCRACNASGQCSKCNGTGSSPN